MECGITQCITPQQHHRVSSSSPGSSGSHSSGSGIARHGCPTLVAKITRVIVAAEGGDPAAVAAGGGRHEGGGAIVATDEDALAAAQVAPPDKPKGALTFRDYPPEPPDDSSIFSDWLLNVPLPFGPNDPPLIIRLICCVEYCISH